MNLNYNVAIIHPDGQLWRVCHNDRLLVACQIALQVPRLRCAEHQTASIVTDRDRREFIKQAGLAVCAWTSVIQSSLAVAANRSTGSIMDVEHVVILMQENRAFDHYFGTLRGVSGFSDCGSAVWQLAGHIETGRISRSDPAMG